MKYNLGDGGHPLEGWINLDGARGDVIYPLGVPDNSADEIRASHVLEHYPHGQVLAVLSDWVRALKPGGRLRIAVPDLERIAKAYLSGSDAPIQGYLMGGQVDARDYHRSAFDREVLTEALRAAGLVGIHFWRSELEDCAALPISLNLGGWKRPARWPSVSAVMSVPRLGFMDNFFAAFQALMPLGIRLRKTSGAFWGQCLTRAIEEVIAEESPEWLLTIDYDSVYQKRDVEDLLAFAIAHQADALAPVQASRSRSSPLFYIEGPDGKPLSGLTGAELERDLLEVTSAHFGLTLLRAEAFAAVPRPWFLGRPDVEGSWNDGRVDDDIHFWQQWRAAGRKVHIALRVPIGHAELMVRWPDEQFQPIHQHPSEFWKSGPPPEVWT